MAGKEAEKTLPEDFEEVGPREDVVCEKNK